MSDRNGQGDSSFIAFRAPKDLVAAAEAAAAAEGISKSDVAQSKQANGRNGIGT
jgi:hypothetical protein